MTSFFIIFSVWHLVSHSSTVFLHDLGKNTKTSEVHVGMEESQSSARVENNNGGRGQE